MKWKGRRQSTNIVDARGTTAVTIGYVEDIALSNVVIRADGEIIWNGNARGEIFIGIQVDSIADDIEAIIDEVLSMTGSQKAALKMVLAEIIKTNPGELRITSSWNDLEEAGLAIYKNMSGK